MKVIDPNKKHGLIKMKEENPFLKHITTINQLLDKDHNLVKVDMLQELLLIIDSKHQILDMVKAQIKKGHQFNQTKEVTVQQVD